MNTINSKAAQYWKKKKKKLTLPYFVFQNSITISPDDLNCFIWKE